MYKLIHLNLMGTKWAQQSMHFMPIWIKIHRWKKNGSTGIVQTLKISKQTSKWMNIRWAVVVENQVKFWSPIWRLWIAIVPSMFGYFWPLLVLPTLSSFSIHCSQFTWASMYYKNLGSSSSGVSILQVMEPSFKWQNYSFCLGYVTHKHP